MKGKITNILTNVINLLISIFGIFYLLYLIYVYFADTYVYFIEPSELLNIEYNINFIIVIFIIVFNIIMFIKNRKKTFIGTNYLMMDIVLILRIICSAIFSTGNFFGETTSMGHIITYTIFNTLLLFLGVFGIICSIRDNENYADNKVILVILALCIIASIIGGACMIVSDELQEMFFMWSI